LQRAASITLVHSCNLAVGWILARAHGSLLLHGQVSFLPHAHVRCHSASGNSGGLNQANISMSCLLLAVTLTACWGPSFRKHWQLHSRGSSIAKGNQDLEFAKMQRKSSDQTPAPTVAQRKSKASTL
jgi:hypothetical protein